MRNTIILVSIFFCFSFITTAQTDNGKANNLKLIKVERNIYMIQGKGGNIGLIVGNDGILMIDDQFEESIPDILNDIKRVNDKPVKYLINTHHHPDHVGGNALLAEQGVIVFAHENVRNRLMGLIKAKKTKIGEDVLPVITFTEDISFHFNNENIFAFHVHNAHTDGDVMVYFTNSNVLHTGDTFFNGKYPFIDIDSGGSLKGSIEALEKILMIADEGTKIIPGHGNLATIKEVKLSKVMLAFLWNRIKLQYVNGKTLEEVLAMKELTEKFDADGYGDGFITSEEILRIIYKDVEKERSSVDTRSMEERLKDQQKELEKKGNKKIKG